MSAAGSMYPRRFARVPRLRRALPQSAALAAGLLLLALSPARSSAQQGASPLQAGADLASGLIWRGQDYSTAPTLQPWLEVSRGPWYLEVGAAWAVDGSWWGQDASAAWLVRLAGAELALVGSAYFFPDAGWADASPVLELGIAGNGPTALPVRFFVGRNVLHDAEGALYGEFGLAPAWKGLEAGVFVGAGLNRTRYYGADAGEVISAGISLDYTERIAGSLALQVGAAGIYNPTRERGWGILHAGIILPLLPAATRAGGVLRPVGGRGGRAP